jgi:hypothetical protein
MGANEPRQSLSELARAEAFKHDQMLLRAVHKCQRVLYQEQVQPHPCCAPDRLAALLKPRST